jgi:hypothetical protein
MPTVYAVDIRRKKRVRYKTLVHYAGSEGFNPGDPPRPWATRCGTLMDPDGETPQYLGDDDNIMVTCVMCLGDRRRG